MGTNGVPWSKAGFDGRVIMLRKRNNSGGEMDSGKSLKVPQHRNTFLLQIDTGSSLLCNPSSALQKLVPKMDSSSIVTQNVENEHAETSAFLQKPVMQFVMQNHDLESLQLAMRQAVR